MSKVLVTESSLEDIADAIRAKNGTENTYKPGQMAAAIEALPGPSTLVSKSITQNGSYDPEDDGADGYSAVTVDVPNSYAAGDEGKVVSNGALVQQTARASEITANGTYDTTTNDSVTVNVESGSGGGTGPQYLLNPAWSRKLTASLGSGRIYQLASYIAYVVGSSSYNYVVANFTVDGASTPCIKRSPASYSGYISFAEPVPADARKLFVQIQYQEQSSNYGRFGQLALGTVFDVGNTAVKTINFVNSGMTVEAINSQSGVTINSTSNKSLAMQVVEIDISDLTDDVYLRFFDTNANPILAGIWYTYDDGGAA